MLEIGIGTGLIALGLQELGFRVLGVDPSEPMASRARERIGPRVVLGDARRLPVRDGAFGQAFSVWVLHVVGDPLAAMTEAARVLAPGGRYVVVPATNHERHGDPIGEALSALWRAADPEGRRRDDEGRLRELAAAVGLEVHEIRGWPAHDYVESPAEAIEKIETRSISVLWDVDELRWDEVVEPVLADLRALPDPERPLERRSTDRAVVLGKPR